MKKNLFICMIIVLFSQINGADNLAKLRAEQAARHGQRLAEQRAEEKAVLQQNQLDILLQEIMGIQSKLETQEYRLHWYANIDDAIKHYRTQLTNLTKHTEDSFEEICAAQKEIRLPLEEADKLRCKQDFAFYKSLFADKLKKLKRIKQLQDEEDRVLSQLGQLNAVQFTMPQKLSRNIMWSILGDEIIVPAAEQAAPAVPTPAVPTPAVPTPAVPTPAVPTPAVPTPAVPKPAAPKSQFGIAAGVGGAIVTAIVIAITTYIGRRIYQQKKERLMRKYKIPALTPFQNTVWRAIALARIRMPWYLQYLIKNNTRTMYDFLGADPRAAAELYYGRPPTEAEVQSFLRYFFGGMK